MDRTPLFKQCIEIVENSGLHSETRGREKSPQLHVDDTFIQECLEIKTILANLNLFINQIRTPYLEVYEQSRSSSSSSLSIEEKNKIDEEFQYKIQDILQKLKFLQNYEKKRQEAQLKASSNNGIFGIFSSGIEDDTELFWTTVAAHRNLVLKSLNQITNSVSRAFDQIQKKRTARERQISMLNFQDLDDVVNLNDELSADPWQQQSDPDFDSVDFTSGVSTGSLTQVQLQQLDAENQEFLTLKTNQLAKVEKLRSSMAEIVNMLQELSFQLETQAEKLDSLLENQDQIDLDIRLGNRSLTKATSRNKAGTNIIVMSSLVAAFLLLFLDYIS